MVQFGICFSFLGASYGKSNDDFGKKTAFSDKRG